jgi:glycosyltransferase involved in cell wall biosynthesis
MISLLMPTRGRPALVRRFLDSVALHTSRLADVELVIYVDEDDAESQGVEHDRVRITRIVGPVATMGAYNTACLERAGGSIVALVNDDVVIRTPHWDERIRAVDGEYVDSVYLAYPNDLYKGRRAAVFPVLSRRTCEALVDPYPREYRGAMIDYHLLDIFKRLQKRGVDRIRYLNDVVFEHLHYRTGKAPADETYRRRRRWDDDRTFLALRGARQLGADRLAATIEGRPLPPYVTARVDAAAPRTLPAAVGSFARGFLGDRALPLRWRLFLFTWYCGRYLAAGAQAAERERGQSAPL